MELFKIKLAQERKREEHRDREMKKQVVAAKYEREKKAEVRKQKEKDRQALGDITNQSQRRSGRNRQSLDRWEGYLVLRTVFNISLLLQSLSLSPPAQRIFSPFPLPAIKEPRFILALYFLRHAPVHSLVDPAS